MRSKDFINSIFAEDNDSIKSGFHRMVKQNVHFLWISSLIVFFVNAFWLVYDHFFNRNELVTTKISHIILAVMMAVSVFVFIFTTKNIREKNFDCAKMLRLVQYIFYYSILIGIVAVTISKNDNMVHMDAVSPYVGVTLIAFYLFIFVFEPFLDLIDGIILNAITILSTFIPALPFVPGHEAYQIPTQLILRVGLTVAYFAFYFTVKASSENGVYLINARKSLQKLTYADPLTQIPNRYALNGYIDQIENDSKVCSVGVMIIDFDSFKSFNDFYSHVEGDKALCAICNVANEVVKKRGHFISRFGGEEFIVIQENPEREDFLGFAKDILKAIWELNYKREDTLKYDRITATIGCAIISNDKRLHDDYLISADKQLYIGKESGKNCVVFNSKCYSVDRDREFSAPTNDIEFNRVKSFKYSKRHYAVVVDDVEMNRDLLSDILEDSLDILHASNGYEALDLIRRHIDEVAVVLLDIVMPEMDGKKVIKIMDERGWTKTIPILIITAESDPEVEKYCLDNGATDVLRKPFSEMIVKLRVFNAIERYNYKYSTEKIVNTQMEILRENERKLSSVDENTIELLGNVVEARSFESGTHIRSVRGYTEILATKLMNYFPKYGMTKQKIAVIASSSALHDIGKIMIKDDILMKPGRLTDEEFEIMKTHTLLGCKILENSKDLYDDEYFRTGYDICMYHHEKFDGRGYPYGLVGNTIPISAQIVSIADCYDALVQKRVYKAAFSHDEAYNMILSGQCGKFNPDLIDCFKLAKEEFKALTNS